ncbi:MAG: hypothetical protein IJR28_06545 [Ottowia sp.]|nr:hypothetical protein [Ottowia sp.]
MKLKTCAAAIALFATLAGGAAHAQSSDFKNILFLSTLEDRTVARPPSDPLSPIPVKHDWLRYIDRPRRAFENMANSRGGTLDFWDEWLAVSADTLDEAALQAALQAADLVVITTAYNAIDATRFNNTIKPLLEKTDRKKPQAFIAFAYGPNNGDNFRLFSNTIAGIIGTGADAYKGATREDFSVNDKSPYASAAKSVLPDIRSGSLRYMKDIQSEFALYTIDALAPGATTANAHVTFVPHDKANGGACIILVGTANVFIAHTTNAEREDAAQKIAKAFMATLDDWCRPTYEITATPSPAAGGTLSCTTTTVPRGENVECTAVAETGYIFAGATAGSAASVTCDVGGKCTLSAISDDVTVTGVFKALPATTPVTPPPACNAAAAPSACSSAPAMSDIGLLLSGLALAGAAAPALRRRERKQA